MVIATRTDFVPAEMYAGRRAFELVAGFGIVIANVAGTSWSDGMIAFGGSAVDGSVPCEPRP
ncbi:MAG TPA: hypothetical protein VGC96_10145, partial [Candidatus Elarobacter sp.]